MKNTFKKLFNFIPIYTESTDSNEKAILTPEQQSELDHQKYVEAEADRQLYSQSKSPESTISHSELFAFRFGQR